MKRLSLSIALVWILLLLAAWGVWLYQLEDNALTFDESATYFVANRTLPGIITYLRGAVREHPPLYYLMIRGWIAAAGTSEFSLRFFSVAIAMAALVTVGWVARLAQNHVGVARGVLPAAFLVALPGVAYYARDARMYSLCILWAALSTGLFLRDWLTADAWPRRRAVALLAAVHLLALFTHYYLLLFLLVQPLVLLLLGRWRALAAWCGAHGFLALPSLGWLLLAPGLQATTQGILRDMLNVTLPTTFQLSRLLGKLLFAPVLRVPYRHLYILLTLTGLSTLVALWRRRSLGVWLATSVVLPLFLAYQLPQFPIDRYVIFLVLPIALALGNLSGLPLQLPWRPAGVALSALLVLGIASPAATGELIDVVTFERSHYSEVLETVKTYARPNDAILFYGPWQWIQFNYYDPGALPPIHTLPRQAPPLLDPVEAEETLTRLLARRDRLWVLPASVSTVDPGHFAAGWLNTHAHPVWRGDGFTLYAAPLGNAAPQQPLEATFGDVLQLEEVTWKPTSLEPGEPLRLALEWSVLRPLEDDVRLTLELVDGSGHVWARENALPGAWAHPPTQWEAGEIVTDRQGLMVPPGAPPGEYRVRLAVTDQGTGERLASAGESQIDLLTVEVTDAAGWPADDAPAARFCAPAGAPCLDLAECASGGVRFQQGFSVPVTLHWRAPTTQLPDLQLRLEIVHRRWIPALSANPIASATIELAPGYAASDWAPGRLVSLPTALALPPDAPTGRTQVRVTVVGPDGTPWETGSGQGAFSGCSFTVERRPALRRLPRGLDRIRIDFGDEVTLRGYRVEGEAQPGGELRVTYAWYARTHPTAIYSVFNHLLTADGEPVTQADGWPQEGRMLTTQWQPGDYVEDHHVIAIPEDAPPGPYVLAVGLYDAMTGARLPAYHDGQRLPNDQLPIPVEDVE